MEQLDRMTKKKRARYQDIERRIGVLQRFADDAAAQRNAVKSCVGTVCLVSFGCDVCSHFEHYCEATGIIA